MPWRPVLRRTVLLLATVCFGLGFGLNFGKSNQAFYLLPSVQYLQPELWRQDFLANTHHYHPLYAGLGALMLKLEPNGWLIALSNVVAACMGMWCIYRLLRARLEAGAATAAFLMVLSLAAASKTGGPGGSYVFADIFQPSTLGSVGLLGASLAFVLGRWFVSGLCLAFAGAFHLNYLLLASCVFGAAWLGAGERRFARLAMLLGPSLPIWIWFLPVLLATSEPVAGSSTAELRHIYHQVRAPHHYDVATFAPQLLTWLGFAALGIAALLPGALTGRADQRRHAFLLAGFAVLIIPAALGSFVSTTVAQLFAWRIAPHANILAQAALCATAVEALESQPRSLAREELWLRGLGVSALLGGALFGAWPATALLGIGYASLPSLAARARRAAVFANITPLHWRRALYVGLSVILAVVGVPSIVSMSRNSDLLAGRDKDVAALCSWVQQTTTVDTVLLTPPDEGELRFRCKRAIVVDWKATPILPAELFAWFQRIEDVSGRPVRSSRDLEGYHDLDRERVMRLRAKYGFDVVVVRSRAGEAGGRVGAPLMLGAPDFSHGRFLAFRLE